MVNRTLAIAIIISIFLTTWGITVPAIADGSGFLKSDPDYNTIMFCPTPSTLEQGDWYFRDFELFVLNFGYGLTDNLDLSFGTLFPVTGDIELITLGAKLEILDRDTEGLGLALTGGGFILDDESVWSAGAVAGVGDRRRSLNLAVSMGFSEHGNSDPIFMIGGDTQVGDGTKLFAEYGNSARSFGDSDDFYGLINLGVRFFGKSLSVSLSGLRPLIDGDDDDNLFAIPMVMVSKHW